MNVTPPAGPSSLNNVFASAQKGIQRAVKQADDAADQLASGDIDPEPVVNLDEAAVQVKLNAITMRTGDEMIGSLLNVKQ